MMVIHSEGPTGYSCAMTNVCNGESLAGEETGGGGIQCPPVGQAVLSPQMASGI